MRLLDNAGVNYPKQLVFEINGLCLAIYFVYKVAHLFNETGIRSNNG